jgi:hypothetical protein
MKKRTSLLLKGANYLKYQLGHRVQMFLCPIGDFFSKITKMSFFTFLRVVCFQSSWGQSYKTLRNFVIS